jgi:hypothetical protein
MSRSTHARRSIACMLLTACGGLVLVGASLGQSARDGSLPMPSATRWTEPEPTKDSGPVSTARPATLSRQGAVGAMFSHGEDDDQPAGACWLPSVGGAVGPCLCSAGSVEDLLTPDFMRVLLTSWRDAELLTAREWRERLAEVDAACRPQMVAP